MSISRLLAEMRRQGIEVQARNGRLHCSAPPGALTASLRAALRENRAAILEFLEQAQTLARQQRAIVPLQPRGAGIPVFAVPGHNGDVFCYRALARRLGTTRPFFGLQPPGLDGQSAPLARVEELAGWFREQIVSFAPAGPIAVVGFCAGGTVAMDLGRQLLDGGRRVRLVGLIGAPYPSYFRRARRWSRHLAERAAQARGHALRLRELPANEWIEYVRGELRDRKARIASEQAAGSAAARELRGALERATLGAVRRHVPRSLDAPLHLFLPSAAWEKTANTQAAWRATATDRFQVDFGPDDCSPESVLREPAVAWLARVLDDALQAEEPIADGPRRSAGSFALQEEPASVAAT